MPVKHGMSEFKCTVNTMLGSSRRRRACTKQRFQQKKAAGQMRSIYICRLYMTQCAVRRQDAWARSVHAGKTPAGAVRRRRPSICELHRRAAVPAARRDKRRLGVLHAAAATRPSGLFRPTRLAASADGLGHTVGDYCGE